MNSTKLLSRLSLYCTHWILDARHLCNEVLVRI